VAAAVGGLAVLLIVAVSVLSYLLFTDDEEDPSVDIAALATENAATRAALDAESTMLADAGAAQTATAGGEAVATGESTGESEAGATEPAEGSAAQPTEGAAEPTGESTEGEAQPTGASGEPTGEGEATEGAVEGAGESTAGPNVSALNAMLPGEDALPAGLDAEEDTSLDQASVVTALGASRTVEQNLERWGWSGNVGRTWSASDPAALEAGATSNISVSIHGFKDAASAAEAFTFYSDVLAAQEGYEEGEPPAMGENSRILTMTDESGGVIVALYVQQGNVLYRFGGYAPSGGDPTEDVIALATATLPAGE
jgi:hypothetical protein